MAKIMDNFLAFFSDLSKDVNSNRKVYHYNNRKVYHIHFTQYCLRCHLAPQKYILIVVELKIIIDVTPNLSSLLQYLIQQSDVKSAKVTDIRHKIMIYFCNSMKYNFTY